MEVDDDAGTGNLPLVLHRVPAGRRTWHSQPIIAGRYHDRFVRDDGVWRFAERRFFIDLVGDLGHHLLTALPGDA